ncbi:class I SAM-dependent methyltransferase [uncultured Senegalimassilia sp.]|uniref:class I SAM-dependent methyltransferase n=1 Tax=uncultured Senegalimassilia sp. TaxID=1714350 RepID=UPI0025DB6C57|nr:class I SAM-dependent methyltransferase [uncultured Senegalimassilia sp.]
MELREDPNGGQVCTAASDGAACAVGAAEDLAADGDAARGAEEALALRLCALTGEFYRANVESFSQTRQSPWRGWVRLLEVMDAAGGRTGCEPGALHAADGAVEGSVRRDTRAADDEGCGKSCAVTDVGASGQEPLRVLDLACGNLRFERYLADVLPCKMLSGYAVDNCDPLVEAGERNGSDALSRMSFQNLDAIERLSAGCLREALEAPDASCDLAVSFGFMHHVPLERWRVELLRALVAKVRPGGFVVVSFWRFLNSDKLARKAQETTSRARAELGIPELPGNDYLLGWQDTQGLYRYCHHFDEPEIERLLAAVADSAELVSRFEADGKTGNLNEYVVLRVK